MIASRFRAATLVLGLGLLGACADSAGPAAPHLEPNAGLLGGTLGLLNPSVEVLHRSAPLGEDEVASAVIGPGGGALRLEEAGLTVRFPEGALTSPTLITVTAPAGDLVGYHFAPHGLDFRHDVVLSQNLTKTEAGLLGELVGLRAAYFGGDLEPVVDALELLEVDLLGLEGLIRFEIEHFSGYVIATN